MDLFLEAFIQIGLYGGFHHRADFRVEIFRYSSVISEDLFHMRDKSWVFRQFVDLCLDVFVERLSESFVDSLLDSIQEEVFIEVLQ